MDISSIFETATMIPTAEATGILLAQSLSHANQMTLREMSLSQQTINLLNIVMEKLNERFNFITTLTQYYPRDIFSGYYDPFIDPFVSAMDSFQRNLMESLLSIREKIDLLDEIIKIVEISSNLDVYTSEEIDELVHPDEFEKILPLEIEEVFPIERLYQITRVESENIFRCNNIPALHSWIAQELIRLVMEFDPNRSNPIISVETILTIVDVDEDHPISQEERQRLLLSC